MSVAKLLPNLHPRSTQNCPLCGRSNRIVLKGVFIQDGKRELYPDIGYSFCNCKAIFYTDYSNIKIKTHSGPQYYEKPLEEIKNIYESTPSGNQIEFIMPDPFFCEWGQDPYTFEHWNPRLNHVLFDMTQFCEDCKEIGFEIVSADRDFDVHSKTPKTMRIVLRKP